MDLSPVPVERSVVRLDPLAAQRDGSTLPFATVERATGLVIGSTRFMNADHTHRRVEIGSTWIAPPWQR